ncbi:MAG: glycosyltransferase [Nitrososphaerales archaeon]
MPEVSVILASLNERQNLPRLLDQIALLNLPSYEVLVVDDGSTDGTQEYLGAVSRDDARVHPILNDARQTLTIAHLQGITAARGTFVIVMDSDLQHPADSIPAMLSRLRGGADLAIGSRHAPGGSVGGRPLLRGVMSRVATLIAQIFLPESRRVSDPISGYFGFRRSVFRPFDRAYRGYETLLFLLVMCRGQRVTEVAYHFQERSDGESRITQDLGFVRVFLTQVLFAIRFRSRIAAVVGIDGGPTPHSTKPLTPTDA